MSSLPRTPFPRLSALASCALLLLCLASGPVFAGSGYVDETGDVHLNFHFRFPPVQSDLDRVQQQVQRASRLMCDATEGQMRIASAKLSAGGIGETMGDIWYYPPGAINRSRAQNSPIHNGSGRIYLRYDSIRSDVLFHELGHLVLGLGDQYEEQRRFGGACGNGPSFDPDGLIDETNHTAMQQQSFQRCVTSVGERTGRACYEDSDCRSGESCPLPDLMSEFSVASNHDVLRGDDALPADTCPTNRAGDAIWLSGYLGEDAPIVAFDSTDLTTANSSAASMTAREYIDELGVVTRNDADSAHPILVYAEHVAPYAWTLHFGIDRKHLSGTDMEGNQLTGLLILGEIDLEFESTPSVVVPVTGESDQNHRALVQVNGMLVSDPGYVPPTISIPTFVNNAAPVDLVVNFDAFEERVAATSSSWSGSDILAGGVQQLGICGDTTACEGRWNEASQRWEASATTSGALQAGDAPISDWEELVQNVQSNYSLSWQAPTGLPTAEPAAAHDCDAPVDFDVEVDGLDQVYLVMDRSYSMDQERDWLGTSLSRLDWAKAGARGFANLMLGEGVDVGLISFALDVTEDLDLGLVQADGTALPGEHELSTVTNAIDSLVANNNTAIGDALDRARQEFDLAGLGSGQAVVLLGDGEENGGQIDPFDAARDLQEAGIAVYTIPLGNDTDGELLSAIADTTGGEVYDADQPDDLPPLYAQLWGRLKGESPIWAGVPSETQPIIDNWTATTHIIPVEEGSTRLSVMLSGRGESAWDPICQLQSPSGAVVIACDDPTYAQVDSFYKLLRVPNPEPGNWALLVYGHLQPPQRSYIWAHSDNPAPDCWAGVAPGFLNDEPADGLPIRATASYEAPLGQNVLYLAQVTTPNGTVLPSVFMEINDRQNGGETVFSDFQGRGRYEILVSCLVTEESIYSPGERADLLDILQDERPVGFLRQARTSFFLDSQDFPPIPPGTDDCDGDGFPDTTFPGAFDDDDGDGVQNYCDTDDDNDDVPDSEDRCDDEAETFGRFERRDPIDGCAVPEPGFSLGVAIGLIALGAARRRSGQRSSRTGRSVE